jgi:hypothetical protein
MPEIRPGEAGREKSWSDRGAVAIRVGSVSGGCLTASKDGSGLPAASSFPTTAVEATNAVIDARAFGIRPGEASRHDR